MNLSPRLLVGICRPALPTAGGMLAVLPLDVTQKGLKLWIMLQGTGHMCVAEVSSAGQVVQTVVQTALPGRPAEFPAVASSTALPSSTLAAGARIVLSLQVMCQQPAVPAADPVGALQSTDRGL
jgi:hypothetical protein